MMRAILRPMLRPIVGEASTFTTPIPNGSITVGARGSVWFDGVDDYYTVADATNLNYADADWTVFALIKYTKTSGTQYIFNHGNTGGAQNVQLYLVSGVLTAQIRTSAGASTAVTGATLAASNAGGWYVVGVRRTGTNYQVFSCLQDGAVTNGSAGAITTPAAITPSGAAYIASRYDALAARLFTGHISYVAKVDAAVSDAQVNALAAGGDPSTLSPSMYIRLDTAAATINDSGSGANVATRVGAPQSRGAARITGQPFTIDTQNGRIDAVYGYVFQRASGGTSRNISFSGTYNGSPAGIEARVINAAGTGVTAWKRCTTPSAGVWNVTLTVPQGSELTLEVRDTVTTTNFARTQLPWGVGAVLLFTGESIADQQASGSAWADSASTDYPSSTFAPDRQKTSILYMRDAWLTTGTGNFTINSLYCDAADNTLWRVAITHSQPTVGTVFSTFRAANPTYYTQVDISTFQVDTVNNSSGVVMHVLDRVQKYAGIPCMAVFGAKTGSKLASGGAEWGSPYTSIITHGKLKAAIANTETDCEAIYWLQGANDANDSSPPSTATYQAALEALIPVIRGYVTGRTASTLPVFLPTVGTNTGGGSAVDAGWRQVRNGILAAIPNITNAFSGGEMYDLTHSSEGAYSPHPNAAGYVRLGKREAQCILNYLLPATYTNPMEGASVLSATANGSGTHIDVAFTLNYGTTLEGLTADTGLTGFRVLRSGTPQTITAAVVQFSDTIRLSGAFANGDVVEYIDTQNPVVTNSVYTNASVLGDSAGVPVRPFTSGLSLSGISAYLLDTYSATAAYSLRQLKTGVTNVVRVRRSSDNTEQDFTAAQVTDGTLTTFTDAGDGFVTTWYDQSGNGYNVIQATQTNQPQIVTSGVVNLENGKPTIEFDGSNDLLTWTHGFMNEWTSLSVFFVLKAPTQLNNAILGPSGTNSVGLEIVCANVILRPTLIRLNSISKYTDNVWSEDNTLKLTSIIASSTSTKAYRNSVEGTSVSTTGMTKLNYNGVYALGQYTSVGFNAKMRIEELIIYNTDQTANRTAIESNINTYYGIY